MADKFKPLIPPPEEVAKILKEPSEVLKDIAVVCNITRTQMQPAINLAESIVQLFKVPYEVLYAIEQAADALLKGKKEG